MGKNKLSVLRKVIGEMREAKDRVCEARVVHGESQQQAGFFLREAREQKGLSLRKAAKLLGFSAPFLSDIERGNRPISSETAERYTALLEATK